jgi:hypothetical protein
VILETLAPAERLAFVLHDLFAVPFEEIASIVGRSPAAARQLASRARRRVQGAPAASGADLARQRSVVAAFLAALRGGDLDALLQVLDPEIVVRIDPAAVAPGAPTEVRGARTWATQAVAFGRGARSVQQALVDGVPGLILAPRGRLFRALCFTFTDDTITAIEVIADPARLAQLDVAILDD